MKFILISAALMNLQPIYDNQTTCELAAQQLHKNPYYEDAVCIPMPAGGSYGESLDSRNIDRVFDNFFDLIKKLQEMEKTAVDNTLERSYTNNN